jgi:hypothetical protein
VEIIYIDVEKLKLAHSAASFSFILTLMSSNIFCGIFCELIFSS